MPEPPKSPGVMAAPNRALVTARVRSCEPAENIPGKWLLEVEFEASENRQGANFARVGESADAFTFVEGPIVDQLRSAAGSGGRIRAEAEYLGGPEGGSFQLYDPQVLD